MKTQKAKKIARKGQILNQVGALPYRRVDAGAVEFLLLTSRGTRRFIIPKGWQMKDKTDQQVERTIERLANHFGKRVIR